MSAPEGLGHRGWEGCLRRTLLLLLAMRSTICPLRLLYQVVVALLGHFHQSSGSKPRRHIRTTKLPCQLAPTVPQETLGNNSFVRRQLGSNQNLLFMRGCKDSSVFPKFLSQPDEVLKAKKTKAILTLFLMHMPTFGVKPSWMQQQCCNQHPAQGIPVLGVVIKGGRWWRDQNQS